MSISMLMVRELGKIISTKRRNLVPTPRLPCYKHRLYFGLWAQSAFFFRSGQLYIGSYRDDHIIEPAHPVERFDPWI